MFGTSHYIINIFSFQDVRSRNKKGQAACFGIEENCFVFKFKIKKRIFLKKKTANPDLPGQKKGLIFIAEKIGVNSLIFGRCFRCFFHDGF